MQSSGVIARYDNVREIAFGSILNTYVGVGPSFANPPRVIKMWNTTDADLYISFNGLDNEEYLPAGSGFVTDLCANKADVPGLLEQPAYQRIFVKYDSGAPTLGKVVVIVIYASTN